MLIDAQHPRTRRPTAFGIFSPQVILKPTLHRSAADALPLAQPTPVHPIPVRHKHAPPEWFGRSLARQYSGKALPETPAAIATPIFAAFHFQQAKPQPPAF